MKKLFCILLAIIMLFSLFACGKDTTKEDDDDDIRGTVTTDPTKSINPTENSTPGNDQNNNQGNNQSNSEAEFSLGKTSGSTYTNDFLGLEFALPAGWTFYSEAQILELNNITSNYYDEQAKEQLKNATIIYDMLATHPTTNSSVNVNLEKLNSFQLMNLNIKANLESQFPTITATLKNMGFSNINIQYQKLTVDGKEYDGLVISATLNNIPMYQAAFAFLRGNYLACVTVCSMQTDNRTSILNYFSFD